MIALGCDHRGYKLKEEIKRYLDESGIEIKDLGTFSEERVDYPNIAKEVSKAVQNKECEKGILICGSGIGMSIVANKFKGIRCANISTEQGAKMSRAHGNTNVLALGSDYLSVHEAICIVRMWIATEFDGGRHEERLKMIDEIEKENMK